MNNSGEGPHAHSLIEVKGGDQLEYITAIDDFKKDKGIHFVLAFSGGADDDSPVLRQLVNKIQSGALGNELRASFTDIIDAAKHDYVADIIRGVLAPLRGYRIAVQTGGTQWGVPKVAAEVAREFGFSTIGVFPLRAKVKGQVLSEDLLDLGVCVHPFIGESEWGDESPIYTKTLGATIVIGGGAGTMVEVAHILKLNERNPEHPKHIIPIYGTGGTADKIAFFPGKPEIMAACIPHSPIVSGEEAHRYLVEREIIPSEIYNVL